MEETFQYDAPQYVDFTNLEVDKEADKFFDKETEPSNFITTELTNTSLTELPMEDLTDFDEANLIEAEAEPSCSSYPTRTPLNLKISASNGTATDELNEVSQSEVSDFEDYLPIAKREKLIPSLKHPMKRAPSPNLFQNDSLLESRRSKIRGPTTRRSMSADAGGSKRKPLTIPRTPQFLKRPARVDSYYKDDSAISAKFRQLQDPTGARPRTSRGPIRSLNLKLHSEGNKSNGNNLKRKLPEMNMEAPKKFVSMAEAIIHFQSDTPDRFRSKPKFKSTSGISSSTSSCTNTSPKRVVPKSPNLMTRNRFRPIYAKSQKDIEEEEIEDMKKHQFKATALKKDIVFKENPVLPKVEVKAATIFKPFNLTEMKHTKPITDDLNEVPAFHARPVPKNILKKTVGLGEKVEIPATVPQSPAFALKHRETKWKSSQINLVEPTPEVPAKKSPHVGVPYRPIILQGLHTKARPFSFEERDKQRKEEKERKIKETLEAEMKGHEFHAQLLPNLEPVLPEKKPAPSTVFQPFNLEANARGIYYRAKFHQKVEEEVERHKQAVQFRARPNTVTTSEPFVPILPQRNILSDIEGIHNIELNTEKRAKEREEYDQIIKQKEEALAIEKKQFEERQAQEEEIEVARLRQEAVHKAQPIRKYRPLPSDIPVRPLTEPESPNFSNRFKK